MKPQKLIKVLEKFGFVIDRQKGSHVILKHPNGMTTVVPMHPGRDVDRRLVRRIINEAGLDREEFLKVCGLI